MKQIKLSSNMEDYLETIFILKNKKDIVRVRDIANILNVKTPSVTYALNVLSKNEFVIHEKYEYVELTSKGRNYAEAIRNRHSALYKFLNNILNINPELAEKDACKMEHSVSTLTLKRLIKFMQFIEGCSAEREHAFLTKFEYYCKQGKRLSCNQSNRRKIKK